MLTRQAHLDTDATVNDAVYGALQLLHIILAEPVDPLLVVFVVRGCPG